MVRKPGKHQRSKQRCQDLGWKVHDHAKSFVCSHTLCMNYVANTFLFVCSSVSSKQLLCFVHGQKSEQKPTTKNFVEFHNHSPLLTMVGVNCFIFSNISSGHRRTGTFGLGGRWLSCPQSLRNARKREG